MGHVCHGWLLGVLVACGDVTPRSGGLGDRGLNARVRGKSNALSGMRDCSVERGMMDLEGTSAHVEFEDAGNRDYGFWPIAVLEQRKLERRRSADKEAAAAPVLLLGDPSAAAVLADQKER